MTFKSYATSEAEVLLANARKQFRKARRLKYMDEILSERAERAARYGLALYARSMNWFEAAWEEESFESVHLEMDEEGQWVREAFGCHLTFEGGSYSQQCPVALAHKRIGCSIEAKILASRCTICDQDPEDCRHITGRIYDGETCYRKIVRAELLATAFVGRPASPDSRLQAIPISHKALRKHLGSSFRIGVKVNCDRCAVSCGGIERPFDKSK